MRVALTVFKQVVWLNELLNLFPARFLALAHVGQVGHNVVMPRAPHVGIAGAREKVAMADAVTRVQLGVDGVEKLADFFEVWPSSHQNARWRCVRLEQGAALLRLLLGRARNDVKPRHATAESRVEG